MNELTQRFISIYEYLKINNYIKDKNDFATKISVSSSMLTEIWKGRTNIGIKIIQNTVKEFHFISIDWLITGEGEMLRSEERSQSQEAAKQDCKHLENIIEEQKQQISSLIEQNKLLLEQNRLFMEQIASQKQEKNKKIKHL